MTLYDETDDIGLRLSRVEKRLTATESKAQAIETIRATARAIIGSDGITIVLREGDLCHYVEEDAITPLWKGQRFPMTACISGWSMLNAQTAVIEDVFTDPRIPHDAYRPTFVKSLIMTPIGDTKPVAAIGAYWQEKRKFTASEIATTKTLSLIIGKALSYLV
ncbi:MAG TPA: GAF domain-containing protein [Rhizomicrobium sp.]|jgi:two-component system CheB/CheR fusion protein